MSWHPTRLTPAQLEARRLAAGRLLRAGRLSQAEIARAFGVSRAAVCQWQRRLERAGLAGLRRRPHPGRPSRLSAGAWRDLGRRLRQGAQAHGFPTEQWTLRRIGQLVQRCYGVRYHRRSLAAPLQAHGFTVQRPAAQAKERDDALVGQRHHQAADGQRTARLGRRTPRVGAISSATRPWCSTSSSTRGCHVN